MGQAKYSQFLATLGHGFSDYNLLERALCHASLDGEENNERLEFLGDRVLGLVVAEHLMALYPQASEGDLARRFAQLVSRATCARIAQTLDLGAVLKTDKGAAQHGGAAQNVLADGCEAILGAVYCDAGIEAARRLILTHWADHFEAQTEVPMDGKTALQEWLMKRGLALPSYEIIDRTGFAHAPVFQVRVTAAKRVVEATGKSRRVAEQVAATHCLEQLLRHEELQQEHSEGQA